MRVFSDLRTTRYESPGHPEGPWRVARTYERLKAAGLELEPPDVEATEDDVLVAHTPEHWRSVREGTFRDPDTPHFPGIDEIALLSLSGALSAGASAGGGRPAFSLMRPPGHHAARERVSGFCYVNNMAVACLREVGPRRRVATLDIDVHHGDGTEAIALGTEGWRFVSIHQFPLYPGTGDRSRANCYNLPLPPGTGEKEYLAALDHALTFVSDFEPDLLGVSAGFDTYKDCPLAHMRLEKKSYRKIGERIAATGLKRFALLEGGYAEDLPELVENFLTGFAG